MDRPLERYAHGGEVADACPECGHPISAGDEAEDAVETEPESDPESESRARDSFFAAVRQRVRR